MGREFYYVDENGNKADASLHEEILADGDTEAATAVTKRRLKARGWTDQEISDWLKPE